MRQLRVRDAEALRDQKAAGSNPATSTLFTICIAKCRWFFLFIHKILTISTCHAPFFFAEAAFLTTSSHCIVERLIAAVLAEVGDVFHTESPPDIINLCVSNVNNSIAL